MILNASTPTISIDKAIEIAKTSIEKKGLACLEPLRKVISIDINNLRKTHFPYYILDIVFCAESVIRGKNYGRQVMAMDGLTGEVGVVVGIPKAQKVYAKERNISFPNFTELQAENRIIDYMVRYTVCRKRFIPVLKSRELSLVYKPAYIIMTTYEEKGRQYLCRKIVDAESGYLVYRYDSIKDL